MSKNQIEPIYEDAPEIRAMAIQLRDAQDAVCHIDINEILFLKERETSPKAAAKCYALSEHPIKRFTSARYCIVFYESKIDYFTPEQRAILLLHELLHIPETGGKLIDHDIKDFYSILRLGIDWNQPGAKVPNLLQGDGDEQEDKKGNKREKAGTNRNKVQADVRRAKTTKRVVKSRASAKKRK